MQELFKFMLGMLEVFEEVNGRVVEGTTDAYCDNDGWKGVPTKSPGDEVREHCI